MFGIFKSSKKEDLQKGLEKTRESFFGKIAHAIAGKSKVDADFLDNLEEILIGSDLGVNTTIKVIERFEERVRKDKYLNTTELNQMLREEIQLLMTGGKTDEETYFGRQTQKPKIIMVVGVNGVGKTTTIGKLSSKFVKAGQKVLLGAGDTFRAAAVDQLKIWAQRSGADIVDKGMNADPAAVAYEAAEKAVAGGYDILLLDTAGRLHNKVPLMNELSKIRRVLDKVVPGSPHEVLLVLDASTGQNAFEQAKHFTEATQVSALALTKLDGTAKGGVVIGIADQFKIPVRFLGVGEGVDHLQLFDPELFVDSLFNN